MGDCSRCACAICSETQQVEAQTKLGPTVGLLHQPSVANLWGKRSGFGTLKLNGSVQTMFSQVLGARVIQSQHLRPPSDQKSSLRVIRVTGAR